MELPLGATEDRICGTIDIEKALGEGIKAYEPGLLVRVMVAAASKSRVLVLSSSTALFRSRCPYDHSTLLSVCTGSVLRCNMTSACSSNLLDRNDAACSCANTQLATLQPLSARGQRPGSQTARNAVELLCRRRPTAASCMWMR